MFMLQDEKSQMVAGITSYFRKTNFNLKYTIHFVYCARTAIIYAKKILGKNSFSTKIYYLSKDKGP